MEYFIQPASEVDFTAILQIYEKARNFMTANGNPNQWGKTYPDEKVVIEDIARENLYTVRDDTGIHGVFYFGKSYFRFYCRRIVFSKSGDDNPIMPDRAAMWFNNHREVPASIVKGADASCCTSPFLWEFS